MTTPATVIPPPVMQRIRDRAEEAYPEECCGFLTGFVESGAGIGGARTGATTWNDDAPRHGTATQLDATDSTATSPTVRVLEEIPARNAAAGENRRREFLVEPKDLLDVMKTYRDRDEDVVGFYHSHPDHEAELSETDLKFARLWPRTVWLIVPVSGRETGEGKREVNTGAAGVSGVAGVAGVAGQERAWWLPGTEAGRAEMIIRSSASAPTTTPREEKA